MKGMIPIYNHFLRRNHLPSEIKSFYASDKLSGLDTSFISIFVNFQEDVKLAFEDFNTKIIYKRNISRLMKGHYKSFIDFNMSISNQLITKRQYRDFDFSPLDLCDLQTKKHPIAIQTLLEKYWSSTDERFFYHMEENSGKIETSFIIENNKRNIFKAVPASTEAFEAVIAYRELMGKRKYSIDSGWKCARIKELPNKYIYAPITPLKEVINDIKEMITWNYM